MRRDTDYRQRYRYKLPCLQVQIQIQDNLIFRKFYCKDTGISTVLACTYRYSNGYRYSSRSNTGRDVDTGADIGTGIDTDSDTGIDINTGRNRGAYSDLSPVQLSTVYSLCFFIIQIVKLETLTGASLKLVETCRIHSLYRQKLKHSVFSKHKIRMTEC